MHNQMSGIMSASVSVNQIYRRFATIPVIRLNSTDSGEYTVVLLVTQLQTSKNVLIKIDNDVNSMLRWGVSRYRGVKAAIYPISEVI